MPLFYDFTQRKKEKEKCVVKQIPKVCFTDKVLHVEEEKDQQGRKKEHVLPNRFVLFC